MFSLSNKSDISPRAVHAWVIQLLSRLETSWKKFAYFYFVNINVIHSDGKSWKFNLQKSFEARQMFLLNEKGQISEIKLFRSIYPGESIRHDKQKVSRAKTFSAAQFIILNELNSRRRKHFFDKNNLL